MNITKEQLKQIIKEEIEAVQSEHSSTTLEEEETLEEGASLKSILISLGLAAGAAGLVSNALGAKTPDTMSKAAQQVDIDGDGKPDPGLDTPEGRALRKYIAMKNAQSPDVGFNK
mgnify:FL=1